MQHLVTLPEQQTDDPHLTAEEVEALCNFTFCIHDHSGMTPGTALFWNRLDGDGDELWRFWN